MHLVLNFHKLDKKTSPIPHAEHLDISKLRQSQVFHNAGLEVRLSIFRFLFLVLIVTNNGGTTDLVKTQILLKKINNFTNLK